MNSEKKNILCATLLHHNPSYHEKVLHHLTALQKTAEALHSKELTNNSFIARME